MIRSNRPTKGEYTKEEMLVLASLRRSSGRTCRDCAWFAPRGSQKGCFPEGEYRKWLSPEELDLGCDRFVKRAKKG